MTYRVWSVEQALKAGAAAGPVLGLDTGSPLATLGIAVDGRLEGLVAPKQTSHCAGLPEAVDEVLASARLKLADLRGIGVAIGPGSFTGLRVGLSYAKGLARARGIALAGVPTLDAMALAAQAGDFADAVVCPILDARRGEVYAALYHLSGNALEKKTDDLALPMSVLAGIIDTDKETILVGAAAAGEFATLAAGRGARVTLLAASELSRTGGLVAALAAVRIAHHKADEAGTLEPLYVRAAGAEKAPATEEWSVGLWNAVRKS